MSFDPRKDRRKSDQQLRILQNKLDLHIAENDRQFKRDRELLERVIEAQEKNTETVNRLEGLLEAWEAGAGVIKVGSALGRLVKWLAGFAVIGGIFAWIKGNGG